MNDKTIKSDSKIILALKKRYNFIVVSADHEIYIDRFRNRLKSYDGFSDKDIRIRFANALQKCLEDGDCTIVNDHNPPLFDFSCGSASSKYW